MSRSGAVRHCALERLCIGSNKLRGDLEPLRGCTALEVLALRRNEHLTGGLEPLRACKALQVLDLCNNRFTGGLEPLRGCPVLQDLDLEYNDLAISKKDRDHFEERCGELWT